MVDRGLDRSPARRPDRTRASNLRAALVAGASVAAVVAVALAYRQRLVERVSWVAPQGRRVVTSTSGSWIDRIRCPVHLVAGVDDAVLDHAHLRHVSTSHANVTYDERPGGHDLPLTDAAHCAGLIGRTARELS